MRQTERKNGKFHYAQHICVSCWQKDYKKLEHPEFSSSCPDTKLCLKSNRSEEDKTF